MRWESVCLSPLTNHLPVPDVRDVMSRFLNVLRSWLVIVSIIAAGNTLQSFRDHTFLYEKLYTGKPDLGETSEPHVLWEWPGLACLYIAVIQKLTQGPGSYLSGWPLAMYVGGP